MFCYLHGGYHDTLLACTMWLPLPLVQIAYVQGAKMKPCSQDRQNMHQKSDRQYKYVAEWCLKQLQLLNTFILNFMLFQNIVLQKHFSCPVKVIIYL